MKLAWKELKFNKGKYFMVEAIVVLLIFMVLFLSGLANGLKRAVSASIENMDAAYFVVSDDAEELLTRSNVTVEQKNELETMVGGPIATLNIQRMNITKENEATKIDITYFAVEEDSFLLPDVTEGNSLSSDYEGYQIILDDSFEEEGIAVGDQISDATSGIIMTVTGFTHGEYYGHSSVGFILTDTFTAIRKELNPAYEESFHTVVIQEKTDNTIHMDGLDIVDKSSIIKSIPGYLAEQMTITMIIWVLVVVSAAILGVFFYVLTIQKQKQFGVLKAIGMRTGELSAMIVSQVVLLSTFGMVIGNVLVFALSNVLPASMPFYLQAVPACTVSVAFVAISILCSLLSARKVAKVDPIVTIGGNE